MEESISESIFTSNIESNNIESISESSNIESNDIESIFTSNIEGNDLKVNDKIFLDTDDDIGRIFFTLLSIRKENNIWYIIGNVGNTMDWKEINIQYDINENKIIIHSLYCFRTYSIDVLT